MIKKISLSLIIILSITMLTACGKEEPVANTEEPQAVSEEETSNENENTSAVDSNISYAITNDYVKVAEYKNLTVEGYNTEVSESEINNFIDYELKYVSDIQSSDSEDKTDETEDETSTEGLTYKDLTDELVVEISNGSYQTVEDFRAYVKEYIAQQNESTYMQNTKVELFNDIVEKSQLVNYSEEDYKRYIDYARNYYSDSASYLGLSMDEFKKETLGFETEDEYEEQIRQEALSNLKAEYIISAIAEKENLFATDDEVDKEIKSYINDGYASTEEEVLGKISRNEIVTNINYYKILDFIYSNANIKPYEEPAETASSDLIVPDTDN